MNTKEQKKKLPFYPKAQVKFYRHCAELYAKFYLRKHKDLNDIIAEVKKLSASVGLSDHEYVRLYQMVRNVKPEYALECGTGKSTFIIAHAMYKNRNGKKLVTLEESDEWAEKQRSSLSYIFSHKKAKDWFPDSVDDLVELILSPVSIERHRIWDGSAYSNNSNYPFTFIMVDGPKLDDTCFINMDLIKILKRSNIPIFAWIDGRWATVAMCRALFGDKVISKLGWTHSEIYGATREDLFKPKGLIAREMFKMVKHL